jgi:PAS domain S-box-containing protein
MMTVIDNSVKGFTELLRQSLRLPCSREAGVLLGLAILGSLGNHFSLELFFGAELMFGSIATLIAIRISGTLWGTLIAIIVSSYTCFLLGHLCLIIIFALEAFVVGFVICCLKRKEAMFVADVCYWLFIGVPLGWFSYAFQFGVSEISLNLILIKLLINGIANVVIADLVFQFFPVKRWLNIRKHDDYLSKLSMHSAVSNLLALFIVFPMLAVIIYSGRAGFTHTQEMIANAVKHKSEDFSRALESAFEFDLMTLSSLSMSGLSLNARYDWENFVKAWEDNIIPGLLNLEISNVHGTVLLSYPTQYTGVSKHASKFASLDFKSFYLSDVYNDNRVNEQHFTVIKLIAGGNYLVGTFSPKYFEHQMSDMTAATASIELIDGEGTIIVRDTNIDFSQFAQGNKPQHQMPSNQDLSIQARWRNSYWQETVPFSNENNWSVQVSQPLASQIDHLQLTYRDNLLVILLISALAFSCVPMVVRILTAPLNNLGDVANAFSEDPNRQDISWPESDIKEVNSLVNQFQKFVKTINSKHSELVDTEILFRTFFNNTPSAMTVKDLDGNFLNVNQKWKDWFKPDFGGFVNGLKPDDIFDSDFLDQLKRLESLAISSGHVQGEEMLTTLASGEQLTTLVQKFPIFNAEGDVVRVGAVNTDISELHNARIEQQNIANELAQLIDSANAPIFGIDANGKINEWNRQTEIITGFEKDEVIGKDLVAQFITDDYRVSVTEVLDRALQGEESANYEFPLFTKSGDRVDVLLNSATRRNASGDIVGVVGVGQDITDLKATQAQVIQTSKLATLGEMATSVAHELNQPLNVIRMAVGNSRRKISRGIVDVEYLNIKLERIEEQTVRAAKIIDHMRMFGRKPDHDSEQIDPRRIFRNALDLMGEQLKLAGIGVVTEFSSECSCVEGNTIQMEQVILNLLINARDAMAGSDGESKITLRVFEDKKGVHLTMHDTGGGIREKILSRVFEPFFTTKDVGKGTGLGLSVSYGIIIEMGGTILVENIGGGARFDIILPVAT